jgi:hypothetical protein
MSDILDDLRTIVDDVAEDAVEDGSGKTDAASYVTVADVDQHHKRAKAYWAALSSDEKEAALNVATAYLDSHFEWAIGQKADAETDSPKMGDEIEHLRNRVEELEKENEKLRDIEIIQDGSHTRIHIGGSDALPLTIHRTQPDDLAICPRGFEEEQS